MAFQAIAEIPEASASGEIASIYADIRRCQGAGLVNLIWRHLATRPGALAWAWQVSRHLYAEGDARAGAFELVRRLSLPNLVPVPPGAWAALKLDPREVTTITRVIKSYNRGNGLNLVALSAIVANGDPLASRRPAAASTSDTVATATADDGGDDSLPPIPPLDALDPAIRALVLVLNDFGTRDDQMPIVASLYRHLAHWPAYLALAWSALAPLAEDGRLEQSIDTTARLGSEIGGALALNTDTEAHADDIAFAREAIGRFVEGAISRMVPIGLMLARSLP